MREGYSFKVRTNLRRSDMDKVTIAISRNTADRLKHLGKYGDTMETIISRVLDEYDKVDKERLLKTMILGSALPLVISAIGIPFPFRVG
jgi:hypothetical protein